MKLPQTKISEEDIASIRRIYENVQITQKEIADLFHIGQPHVSRIVRGLRRNTTKNVVQ